MKIFTQETRRYFFGGGGGGTLGNSFRLRSGVTGFGTGAGVFVAINYSYILQKLNAPIPKPTIKLRNEAQPTMSAR